MLLVCNISSFRFIMHYKMNSSIKTLRVDLCMHICTLSLIPKTNYKIPLLKKKLLSPHQIPL